MEVKKGKLICKKNWISKKIDIWLIHIKFTRVNKRRNEQDSNKKVTWNNWKKERMRRNNKKLKATDVTNSRQVSTYFDHQSSAVILKCGIFTIAVMAQMDRNASRVYHICVFNFSFLFLFLNSVTNVEISKKFVNVY